MTDKTLTLRAATSADCRFYWEVNNAPSTRALSVSSAPIPWDDHTQWFESKQGDATTPLYVAETGGQRVGVVRFDLVDNEAVISVAIAEAHRGRGLGRRVIAEGTRTTLAIDGVSHVIALIRPDNIGSVRAFKAAGYLHDGETHSGEIELLRYVAR
jgi:UDP-2,4-diacetamido-2,4,6-trideoxy-beta-L-altropyranose hydrolase